MNDYCLCDDIYKLIDSAFQNDKTELELSGIDGISNGIDWDISILYYVNRSPLCI